MMKSYYRENLELLLRRSEVYRNIELEECEEIDVVVNNDSCGNEIFGRIYNGREWHFGSICNNEYAIQKWVESVKAKSFGATIYVFGMGDIHRISMLANKFKDNNIVVYEPSLSYFKSIMEVYDLSQLITNDNIYLAMGQFGIKMLRNTAKRFISPTNYKYNIYKLQPQYNVIYEEEYREWKKVIDESVNEVMVHRNTVIINGMKTLEGAIGNYYYCILSNNVSELKNQFKDVQGGTAVLVSAGPSLDKNVDLLKEVKGKALIVAVDTALKPLLKRGIRPDLTVTVDSKKPIELFEYGGEMVDIPIITCISASSEVLARYPGKMIFDYEMDVVFSAIYGKNDYRNSCLETGGSVANNAFTFLREAGFKNIIMIGQDLAYPGNKLHAEDTFKDRAKIDYVQSKGDVEIEDIYGNKVYTGLDMLTYLNWFNSRIKNNTSINVIDATEGGAKIEGTRIMTFREAIDAYIKELPVQDYEKLIMDMQIPYGTELERRLSIFYKLPEWIERTKDDIEKALKMYDKLEKYNENGDYRSEEFKNTVNEVLSLTDKVKSSVFASFAAKIKDEEEYDILEEIYEDKDSVYAEIKLVIDSGRKVLQKYTDSYDLIKGLVDNAVKKAKEEEAKR